MNRKDNFQNIQMFKNIKMFYIKTTLRLHLTAVKMTIIIHINWKEKKRKCVHMKECSQLGSHVRVLSKSKIRTAVNFCFLAYDKKNRIQKPTYSGLQYHCW